MEKNTHTEGEPQVRCEELLACPFCGGPAKMNDDSVNRVIDAIFGMSYWVSCARCHAKVQYQDTPQLAAHIWNLRQANQRQAQPEPTLSLA